MGSIINLSSTPLLIGFGKSIINAFVPDIGLMGYGQPKNIAKSQASPLHTRTMLIKNTQGHFFAYINLELAIISSIMKKKILLEINQQLPHLELKSQSIMLTAQHTHSAPGGLDEYPFYNFTIPNFRPNLLNNIAKAVVESLTEALQQLLPAEIDYHQYQILGDVPIAFNRSIDSYNKNPENQSLTFEERHQAICRNMQAIYIYSDKKLKGFINFFGVHATSIGNTNTSIHHDNKGVASLLFENSHPNTTAIFAQRAAGDVSPNYIWDKDLKKTRGPFKDEIKCAEDNGRMHFEENQKCLEYPHQKINCSSSPFFPAVKSIEKFIDMSQLVSPAAHGVSFFAGTLEGAGAPKFLIPILSMIARSIRWYRLTFNSKKHLTFYQAQDPKDVLLDHRTGEFLGIPLKVWKKIPFIPDPTVNYFIKAAKNNSLETLPWVPSVISIQLLQINQILIVGVPGEITTTAAKRIELSLKEESLKLGLTNHQNQLQIIISSYANSYMGYITTPEEYENQSYEGGHTVYGKNTLPAIIKAFNELFHQLQQNENDSNEKVMKIDRDQKDQSPHPFIFPEKELARRTTL